MLQQVRLLPPLCLLLQMLELSSQPLGLSLQAGQKIRMLRGQVMWLVKSRERLTAHGQPQHQCAWKLKTAPLRQTMKHADLL